MSRRTDRVAELIQEELARIVLRDVADPRLAGVTFTAVDLSGDHKNARVYFSLLDAPDTAGAESPRVREALRAFARAAGFLRHALGEKIDLRHTPRLEFHFDPGAARGARVSRILHEVGADGGGNEPLSEKKGE